MLIAKHACETLRQPASPVGHVAVAVVALSEAIRQGIDVPLDAGPLLWMVVERSPSATWAADATEAIGTVANASLVSKIVQTITVDGAGRDLRMMGLDALCEPRAAAHLTGTAIVALVEVVRGRETTIVANVILGAADARPIDPKTISMIVARWVSTPDPQARIAAFDLLALLPRGSATKIVEHLLISDPSPMVRETAALMIVDAIDDPSVAATLAERVLEHEVHGAVRAALEGARDDALADVARGQNRSVMFSTSSLAQVRPDST